MALFAYGLHCRHFWNQVALLLFNLVLISAASVTDNGKLVTLGNINYFAGGPSVSRIVSAGGFNPNYPNADLLPITIIRTNETVLSENIIRDVISEYSASDDVFQPGFLNSEFFFSYTPRSIMNEISSVTF